MSASTADSSQNGRERARAKPRRKKHNIGVIVAFSSLLALAALALTAPLWAHDPARQSLIDAELPPFLFDRSTIEHFLGTDELGRDQLSRIAYGLRTSILISTLAMSIAMVIGTIIGVVAGYFRGLIDNTLMRIVDIQMSFPAILLVLTFVTAIGPSFHSIVIVLALSVWVVFARVARAQVLALTESELVLAMRAIGASAPRILFLHLVPNIAGPLVVIATLELATLIVAESALGYLGLGVPPPTPSLGAMIAAGQFGLISGSWWLVLMPGIAITAFIMSINMLGDWLRDRLDPRRER